MILFLRALTHAIRMRGNDAHKVWHEEMIWPGGRGVAYFCTCRKSWWPLEAQAQMGPGGDTIDREPPWERKR